LKESQRKILYAGFRKGIDYNKPEIKVAQFGGYVAEHTGYHHGEQNLYDTLIKMAQSFIGSNNIPLFMRRGQFGTRAELGKDAASARYIFTTLEEITRYLFINLDEPLLEYLEDDGDVVEPRYYVPIIPMILANGCTAGIGTGWSCAIPCFNPLDLISAVKIWLDNNGEVITHDEDDMCSKFPELSPWYHTFTGEIKKIDENKYVTHGRVVDGPKNTRIVEELPVGISISDFLSHLGDLKANGTLDFKNNCKPNVVHVTLYEGDEKLSLKELKLTSHLSTTNMVLFNASGRIQKFESVDEIINDFCVVRYELYKRRKAYMAKKLETDLCLVGNKKRFLVEVMRGDIKLFEDSAEGRVAREKDEIVNELEKREFAKIDGDYDYLLSLQIRSITKENIAKLEKEHYSLVTSIAELTAKSEKSMWIEELEALEAIYAKTMNTIATQLAE
jgi:DNA topoisomerase-2